MTVEEYVEARASVEAFEADYDSGMPPVPVDGAHGFLVSHITEMLQNKLREMNQYSFTTFWSAKLAFASTNLTGPILLFFKESNFPGSPGWIYQERGSSPDCGDNIHIRYRFGSREKITAYTRAGVGEFWFTMDELNVINVYRPDSPVARLGLDDSLPSSLGFTLTVKDILAR